MTWANANGLQVGVVRRRIRGSSGVARGDRGTGQGKAKPVDDTLGYCVLHSVDMRDARRKLPAVDDASIGSVDQLHVEL